MTVLQSILILILFFSLAFASAGLCYKYNVSMCPISLIYFVESGVASPPSDSDAKIVDSPLSFYYMGKSAYANVFAFD